MPSIKTVILAAASAPMFFLAACDGYEPVEMTHMVPFTMERTAGKGVMYVRAAMMPAKGPVTEPVTPQPPLMTPAPEPEPEALIEAPQSEGDKVFTTKQGK